MARTRNVPGTTETMPGVPGPAEPLNEPTDDLEPISSVPVVPAPLPARRGRAAPVTESTHRQYKVWEHGTLQRDGKVYQPGDELILPREEGDAIACLVPITPR